MRGRVAHVAAAALWLGALPLAIGHEDLRGMDMTMNNSMGAPMNSSAQQPASYFRYPHHTAWLYAHIALMTLSWAALLPASIMLSIARLRYHLPAQIVFHIANGLGTFAAFVYNHSTPDLYEHDSHSPIGWVATSVTVGWTIMSMFVAYSEHKSRQRVALSAPNMSRHNEHQQYKDDDAVRYSRDSGQGTERNSMSLLGSRHGSRQGSQDTTQFKPIEEPSSPTRSDALEDFDTVEAEKHGLLGNNKIDRFMSRSVRRMATPTIARIVRLGQIILEKFLLPLGFLAITTGFVVYGGLFHEREIFSGLAHFIKGGIFFWYGLLILGRWMGAFAEFGWAWNIRPSYPAVSRWKFRVPSAEFTESFLIWLYGASNVFLEHLNRWGKSWSHQDFEHVSITLLFFGGGLLGMMSESCWAKELMNTTIEIQKSETGEVERAPSRFHASDAQPLSGQLWTLPKTSTTSLNPMPGLVIMILGIMMSSHPQESMVSTMMHSQWGTLLAVAAMARGVTYTTLYIKPPTSHYPSRPPSELVAAFCLTSGGLMFMMSARDVVKSIEIVGLDAMSVFTVTMGLTGLILAWEVVVFALKGWAVRKERALAGPPL